MKKLLFTFNMALFAIICFAQKGSIIFTHAEHSNFDAAKSHAITEVKDGDDLWMYAKFDKPMSSFTQETDAYGNPAYYLRLAIGAAGNSTDWSEDMMQLPASLAAASEIKINLSPGITDRTKANGIFVYAVGKGQPGVWKNSVRINQRTKSGDSKKIAEGAITANVPDDIQRYKKIARQFEEILDGKTVFKEKPIREGSFKDAALLNMVKDELKKKGYSPTKVYFISDNWKETYDNKNNSSIRSVTAVYLYKKGKDCMMGKAYVESKGNPKLKQYGPKTVRLGEEKLIDCN